MKEFKSKVEIAQVADIDSITGTTLSMKTGKTVDKVSSSNDIIPDEKDNNAGGSRYYSQNLTVICDKLPTTLYNRYRNRRVVVKLFDDQDNEFLLGNLDYPARCAIAPKLNQDQLVITCDTPSALVS